MTKWSVGAICGGEQREEPESPRSNPMTPAPSPRPAPVPGLLAAPRPVAPAPDAVVALLLAAQHGLLVMCRGGDHARGRFDSGGPGAVYVTRRTLAALGAAGLMRRLDTGAGRLPRLVAWRLTAPGRLAAAMLTAEPETAGGAAHA